jgi:hypothetical protein
VVVVVLHGSVPGGVGSVDVVPSVVVSLELSLPPGVSPVVHHSGSVGHSSGPPLGEGSVLSVSPVVHLSESGGSSLGGTSASSALGGVDAQLGSGASLDEGLGGLFDHLVGGSFGGSGGNSEGTGDQEGSLEVHFLFNLNYKAEPFYSQKLTAKFQIQTHFRVLAVIS